jgi:glycosyltransferase involved in cell wall biosynthesis
MEKFTVIIPTRDRADTLEHALRTCLSQEYANFEIIVSDNYSADNTAEIINRYRQSNLRYVNTGKRVSMAENFEFALSHVADGFVMFIGDDDGLLPDAIEYVSKIQRKYSALAISGKNAEYCWPSFPDEKRKNLLKWGCSAEYVEMRESRRWIKRCLNFRDIYTFQLPKLYHGFVHKTVIDKARSSGNYFGSITPDAYSSFATAFFVDQYAFSHRPFTIGGASGRSNGVSGFESKGSADEQNKFFEENTMPLHHLYRACPSLEIYMAEAFSQLSSRFPGLTAEFSVDFEMLLRSALSHVNVRTAPVVKQAVQEMAQLNDINLDRWSPKFRLRHILSNYDVFAGRATNILRGVRIPDASVLGVENVFDAAIFIGQRIRDGHRNS